MEDWKARSTKIFGKTKKEEILIFE